MEKKLHWMWRNISEKNVNLICIHLLDRFRYGGAERVALSYQDTLNEMKGIISFVYAIMDPERKSEKNVYLFKNHLTMFFHLLKKMRKSRFLFFTHTTKTILICCLLKIFFYNKVNIIYVRHFQYTRLTKIIFRLLSVFIKKAVLITPAEKNIAEKIFLDKVYYVNNYINHEMIQESRLKEKITLWSEGRKIVAFAGGMKKGKNSVHLLELAKVLGIKDYCYLYIGDGPEREEVQLFHDRDKTFFEGAVFYCGFQNNVISILNGVNFFFFPSWNNYEMMPMVLLEALEANCLCVAYNMKVNRYILPDENLFEFKDYTSIAEAVRNMKIKRIPNPFDAQYGKEKLEKLITIAS